MPKLGTFVVCFAIACGRASSDSQVSKRGVLRVATPGVCLDTIGEEHALACAPPTVRRAGDTLTISLANRHVLTFLNESHGEMESGTMFGGTIASVPLYITSSYGGERPPIYTMIDGQDGTMLDFEELPVFSPDSLRFAVDSPTWEDCELGDGGSLAVYRMTTGLPVSEWSVRSWNCDAKPGWAADHLSWLSPDTLSFAQHDITIADSGRVIGATRTMFLVRSASGWRVVSPPSVK